MSADYLLSYDTVNNSSYYPYSEINDMLYQLSHFLLTLASRTGIEALIGHPDAPNQYTRFLCYTYVNRIEQLDDSTTELTNSLKTMVQIEPPLTLSLVSVGESILLLFYNYHLQWRWLRS